jgi:hypothetical protein
MSGPRYPTLFQLNTRIRLTELSATLGRKATLDDIPDEELDRLAATGFDWLWLLSVWQTGPAAQAISRANPGWRREFEETLPDLKDEDIAGSSPTAGTPNSTAGPTRCSSTTATRTCSGP